MSTVKAINFQHPDAASPSITLDASGNATIPSLPKIQAEKISYPSGTANPISVTFPEAFSEPPAFVATFAQVPANPENGYVTVVSVTATGATLNYSFAGAPFDLHYVAVGS